MGQNRGNEYGNGPNGRNASDKWMEMVNTHFFDHFWEMPISEIGFSKASTPFPHFRPFGMVKESQNDLSKGVVSHLRYITI